MISHVYSDRSNCFRGAKRAVEKTGGRYGVADISIDTVEGGYVFKFGKDEALVEGSGDVDLPADAPAPVVAQRPAVVALTDLDDNTHAMPMPGSDPVVVAEKIAASTGLVIQGVAEGGEVLFTTGSESPQLAKVEPAAVVLGDVILCIAFPAHSSVMWAAKLAKQLKMQVTIRDGKTLEIQQVVEARAQKAAKAKAEGGGVRKTGAGDALSVMLSNPKGATADELQKVAGWNTKPSSFYLRKLAKARGRELVTNKTGKQPLYSFGEQLAA